MIRETLSRGLQRNVLLLVLVLLGGCDILGTSKPDGPQLSSDGGSKPDEVLEWELQLPENGHVFTSSFVVSATGAAIEQLSVELDGQLVTTITRGPVFEFLVDPRQFAVGSHRIVITASGNGETARAESEVLFAEPPPPPPPPTKSDTEFLEDVRAMAPNTWMRIPNSDFFSNASKLPYTKGAGPNDNVALRKVMDAWCGGDLSDTHCRFYVWGGGHGDGSNNGWFYFDLTDAKWKIFKDRDHSVEIDENGNPNQLTRYPNGNPVARHTRMSITVDRKSGRIYLGPSAGIWRFGDDDTIYSLDPTTANYSILETDFAQGNKYGQGRATISLFHKDRLWMQSNVALLEYNPTTRELTKHVSNDNHGNAANPSADIDTHRDLMVIISLGESVSVLDLNNPTEVHEPVPTGDGSANALNGSTGIAYGAVNRRFYAWRSGSTVWEVLAEKDKFQWTKLTPGGDTPGTNLPSGGIFSRWRYWPSENRFVGIAQANEDVVIYRPPN